MQACFWKVCSEMSNAKTASAHRRRSEPYLHLPRTLLQIAMPSARSHPRNSAWTQERY
jgi:hypothetical protein